MFQRKWIPVVEVGEVGVWWQKTKFTKKHSKMLVIQITAMSYQSSTNQFIFLVLLFIHVRAKI